MTYQNHTYPINPFILQKMDSFLRDQNFTHFVTLSMNDYQNIEDVRRKVRELHSRIDRRLLGSKWYKKPKDQRTFFIGFHEHINSNHHVHLLMRVKPEFERYIEGIVGYEWCHLTEKGTVDIQSIYSDGCVPYCLKEQYKSQNFESFIVSTEFIPT